MLPREHGRKYTRFVRTGVYWKVQRSQTTEKVFDKNSSTPPPAGGSSTALPLPDATAIWAVSCLGFPAPSQFYLMYASQGTGLYQ